MLSKPTLFCSTSVLAEFRAAEFRALLDFSILVRRHCPRLVNDSLRTDCSVFGIWCGIDSLFAFFILKSWISFFQYITLAKMLIYAMSMTLTLLSTLTLIYRLVRLHIIFRNHVLQYILGSYYYYISYFFFKFRQIITVMIRVLLAGTFDTTQLLISCCCLSVYALKIFACLCYKNLARSSQLWCSIFSWVYTILNLDSIIKKNQLPNQKYTRIALIFFKNR